VNVLNGFDQNIKLQISDNEQMSNISKMLYEQHSNEEDYQRELRKEFFERGYNEDDVQQWLHI
jgi:small nuclear ribonucleoprotein (snRNP)-like protein